MDTEICTVALLGDAPFYAVWFVGCTGENPFGGVMRHLLVADVIHTRNVIGCVK